jgi:isochorismate pyruvate lyase
MTRPQDCDSMTELRAAIDALDADVVRLLAMRTRFIDRAAELKRRDGLPAYIPARVEEVVSRVRASAAVEGLDPDLAESLWRQMITWSIAREKRLMEQADTSNAVLAQDAASR